jgi:hypothetical protein
MYISANESKIITASDIHALKVCHIFLSVKELTYLTKRFCWLAICYWLFVLNGDVGIRCRSMMIT